MPTSKRTLLFQYLNSLSRPIRRYVQQDTFILSHWACFISASLAASLLFWNFSTANRISYLNSLFLVVSAITQTGLEVVDLSSLSTFQQIVLFVLMFAGHENFVSLYMLQVRKAAFEKRFKALDEIISTPSLGNMLDQSEWDHPQPAHENGNHMASIVTLHQVVISKTVDTALPSISQQNPPLDPKGPVRNLGFHGLSPKTRLATECVEYRGVILLMKVVTGMLLIPIILGCLLLATYSVYFAPKVAAEDAQNASWEGIFLGLSTFTNTGMSLSDTGVIPYQNACFPLLVIMVLQFVGKAGHSILLRFILSIILDYLPVTQSSQDLRTTTEYVLKYPRRIYLYLFPRVMTWWLLTVMLILTTIDWTAFVAVLSHKDRDTTNVVGFRILDGLVQAFSIRSAGFSVVPLVSLPIILTSIYMVMMYISAYPVTITMRRSNVYEERSLGIYARDNHKEDDTENPVASVLPTAEIGKLFFLREQLRRQLSHDAWFLVLEILIIIGIESRKIETDPISFSVFNVIFEIISAYSGVGLSIGLPDQSYSLSGGFHPVSRFILIIIMLRGRHRGLPDDVDMAVQLPSDNHVLAEEQDHQNRVMSQQIT